MSGLFRRFNLSVGIRVIADVLLVNLALLVGLAARAIGLIEVGGGSAAQPDVQMSMAEVWGFYRHSALLLTGITILTFACSGFYTRGRYYRGRYKAVVIAQAVSLAYLIFVFANAFLNPDNPYPRSSLIVAWLATLAAVMAARLWASLWETLVRLEESGSSSEASEPMRHVLVIGGAGYIGSVLCRQLLARGCRVRVLDALLYGDEAIRELMEHPQFEFIHGDSRDTQAVVRSMRGVDAVVHLGEIVGDPATAIDYHMTREVNIAATRMLAEAAKGFGVSRFVYASSCSVYGASDGELTEMSALNPVSEYARAKVAAETILVKLNDERFNPVILRFATVFGLSPRPRFDLAINVLTAKAVIDAEIPVSGGDQWRPFVHVRDVARAIVMTLEAPIALVKGQTFNVGGDELNYTIASAAESIHRAVPSARLVINPNEVDKRDYRVSFAKIARELGFRPQVSLQGGIAEIAEAVQSGRVGHYAAPQYSNLKTLSENGTLPTMRTQHINELYTVRAVVARAVPSKSHQERRRVAPGRRAADRLAQSTGAGRVASVTRAQPHAANNVAQSR